MLRSMICTMLTISLSHHVIADSGVVFHQRHALLAAMKIGSRCICIAAVVVVIVVSCIT